MSTLHKLSLEKNLEISTKDIAVDPKLFEQYKNTIPVVEIDGKIRLGGSTLSNQGTLESVLRMALTS